MRRALIIFLLAIFAFNWFGYRVMVSWLEERARARLEVSLDNDQYDSTKEMIVKAPMNHIAYYSGSFDFIRQNGQIDIGGVMYQFVKMRLMNDSVELVCIPDDAAQRSAAIRDHFIKWNLDDQQASASKKSNSHSTSIKIISGEYEQPRHQWAISAKPESISTPTTTYRMTIHASPCSVVIDNPPEILS